MPQAKNPQEKREQFAKFARALTGELGVAVTFADQGAGPKTLRLPDVGRLDGAKLDMLYACALRQAGHLAWSGKTVSALMDMSTANEYAACMRVENGRIEKALCRKFAGAGEMLDAFYMSNARDPALAPSVFGFDPAQASDDELLFLAFQMIAQGRPDYKFGLVFGERWDRVYESAQDPEILELFSKKIKSWEQSRDIGRQAYAIWLRKNGKADLSKKLELSEKGKAWAKLNAQLKDGLPKQLEPLASEIREAKEKAKELRAQADAKLGAAASQIKALRRRISELSKQKAPFASVQQARKDAMRAENEVREAKEELAQEAASIQSILEKQAAREEKFAQKQTEIEQKGAQKAAELESRLSARLAALEEKIAAAEQAAAERAQKAQEAKTEAGKARSEAQAQKAGEKAQELARRLAELQAELAQKRSEIAEKAKDRAQAAGAQGQMPGRETERLARAQGRESLAMQELAELERALEQAQKETARAAAEAQKKVPQLAGMSPEEILEKIEAIEKEISECSGQAEALEAPAKSLLDQAGLERKKASEAARKMNIQALFALQSLQKEMDKAGLECELCERQEMIEGWDAANRLQEEFDRQATEELGEPVINGSGGGRGMRNAMEEIARSAAGIEEIDPNELFADAPKTGPLSAAAVQPGKEEAGRDGQESFDAAALDSRAPYLVWSKARDKVVPAPLKNAALPMRIKFERREELRKIKELFKRKLRPSFKSRFKGGKEEGDLDARSIWKLAAKEGDDFFEISRKVPEKKTCASILCDLSGSVASLGADAAEKLQAAAFLLSEALSEAGVEHEILGFCAPHDETLAEAKAPASYARKSCRLETIVAKGFSEKSLAGLASLRPMQSDNCDGESVAVACERLRKRPAKNKLLFLVSDGKPFMQDSDPALLDAHLRTVCLQAARDKIRVISLGFSKSAHPVFGKDHIAFDGFSELVQKLGERL